MKNIWRIFSGDMKRLVRNPFALVIAIGLCIIPSLYAWFNIYSNWDPYANTKNIKIAVATEDTGYQMDDGTTVNMGDSVIESLKENDKIGWVFTDTKDAALEGVYSGEYYAAVIISSDFTYSMYNVFREDFKGPTISYYENEKKNAKTDRRCSIVCDRAAGPGRTDSFEIRSLSGSLSGDRLSGIAQGAEQHQKR